MSSIDLKFGPHVPGGAVNLAWVTVPEVTPEQNTFIADLAGTIAANTARYTNEVVKTADKYTISLGDSTVRKTVAGSSVGIFSSPIKVLPPEEDRSGAWRVRVTDGVFRQLVTVAETDKTWLNASHLVSETKHGAFAPGTRVMAVYSLPEIRLAPNQGTPGCLNVAHTENHAFVVDTHTIQLPHRNVKTLISLTINGVSIPFTSDKVTIDSPNGRLTLVAVSVSPADDVQASYWYETSELPYYGFFDDDGNYKDLDLNPSHGHTYNGGIESAALLGKVVTLFLIPTAAYIYDDACDGQFAIERAQDYGCKQFLRWSADLLGGTSGIPVPIGDPENPVYIPRGAYGSAKYGVHRFCATTADREGGADNYSGTDGSVSDLADFPAAVVLARLYVSATDSVASLGVIDTRQRGGGVTDDPAKREATLDGTQLLETKVCWDIGGWDGEPTMLNGTAIIEIPERLLTRSGGTFSEAQIEEIVKKRMPVGVLPVIRYTVD